MLRLARRLSVSALALLPFICAGCNDSNSLPAGLSAIEIANFKFLDEVESNRQDDGTVGTLKFVNTEGETVHLDQFKDEKNVLLVFTRGFSGQLCPFCTTQTSRLIANYDKFTKRDTEVLLVYPGSKAQLPLFMQASIESSESESFPFPVLLDEDLAAVKQLGIAEHLAYPSTFIIDKRGQVRLSYVGSNPADRPSIKALLSQLDRLVE
jgi:peroxiredoxin